MKKFFLIAAAAIVAFASCSKNDAELAKDKGIGFKSYAGRTITKADADFFIPKSQTYLQKQAFGVYAYNTESTPFAGSVANAKKFMTNQAVDFSGESAADAADYTKYSYEPKKYWPNDEDNNLLTFWAYYPYEALSKGFEANTFTVADDPATMVDLLVSDVKEDMTYSKAAGQGDVGVVPFTFHHALTMVKFFVKTGDDYDDVTITLNKLTVKGVKGEGTITPSWSAGATSYAWAASGNGVDFEVCDDDAELSVNGAFFPTGVETDDAYLMIPQGIDNVTAEIEYTVSNGDDDPVVNKVTVNLKTTAVTEWAMNKNVKYTFTVGLKPIEFTAVVTDWDTEVEAGISVE